MKFQVALLTLVIGVQAHAQQGYERTLPEKRGNVAYNESPGAVVQVEPAPVVESQQGSNPIVIMNSQKYQGIQGTSQNVQQQPTTFVEASALSDSRADNLRKQRQGMEVQTEQKIVEKLEEARMEDEKARSERLFGNGFGSGRQDPPPYQPPPPQPVPVVVAPVPVEEKIVIKTGPSKGDIHEEVRAALDDYRTDEVPAQTYFMGAQVGMADYPDAVNVKGNVASGLSLGVVTADRVVVEGTFLYSDYEVQDVSYNNPNSLSFKELNQYNFAVAVKYQLLPGKIRPYAGGVVDYTYRRAVDLGYYGAPMMGPGAEGSSNAFDVGATAGVDLHLTPSFAIGADFRYMTNVSYRRDDTWSKYAGAAPGVKPIEEIDYYTATLNGKFTF